MLDSRASLTLVSVVSLHYIVDDGWKANTTKVLSPFVQELWLILMAIVALVAMLMVYFANSKGIYGQWRNALRGPKWKRLPYMQRTRLCLWIGLDSFLAQSTFFFGHTVEYDMEANMSTKILGFGYAFLVLIVIAAYTGE